jgi:hypothetical protein
VECGTYEAAELCWGFDWIADELGVGLGESELLLRPEKEGSGPESPLEPEGDAEGRELLPVSEEGAGAELLLVPEGEIGGGDSELLAGLEGAPDDPELGTGLAGKSDEDDGGPNPLGW